MRGIPGSVCPPPRPYTSFTCHLRASVGGRNACVGRGFEGRLGHGPDLVRGRARARVAARRSIPFLAHGFRRLKMTRATMNTFTLPSSVALGFRSGVGKRPHHGAVPLQAQPSPCTCTRPGRRNHLRRSYTFLTPPGHLDVPKHSPSLTTRKAAAKRTCSRSEVQQWQPHSTNTTRSPPHT